MPLSFFQAKQTSPLRQQEKPNWINDLQRNTGKQNAKYPRLIEKQKHGRREGEVTHCNDSENTPSIIHHHVMKVSWNKALKILAFPHNGTFKTLVREQTTVMQVLKEFKGWKSNSLGFLLF